MGYDYFQGFFFSKPTIIKQKDISSMNANLFEIFEELNSDSPNYLVISDIIQRDLGLTYKLLMLVNTIKFEAKRPIRSVRYALTFLGINEIFQWVSLIMIKDLQNSENAEMIKLSMIRAKLMELIARELNLYDRESEYFLVGIFSFIDVILDREMKEVLSELPLSATIKNALTDRSTQMGRTLDFLIAYEKTDWENVIGKYPLNLIEDERFLLIYMEALGWAVQMSAQYSI
jgi:EAL and modified HD-GYP domain-containing signal transduction protein